MTDTVLLRLNQSTRTFEEERVPDRGGLSSLCLSSQSQVQAVVAKSPNMNLVWCGPGPWTRHEAVKCPLSLPHGYRNHIHIELLKTDHTADPRGAVCCSQREEPRAILAARLSTEPPPLYIYIYTYSTYR